MRCKSHQDERLFAVAECPFCLRERLEWVRRNIKRIRDFAFTGDAYRQQINEVVDHITLRISEEIGDDPDAEDSAATI